jgi:uncharacterized membrane protein
MEKESVMNKEIKIEKSIGIFGILLFIAVLLVLYMLLLITETFEQTDLTILEGSIPLIVFTGFFIFLVGAMLLSLSLFKVLGGFK